MINRLVVGLLKDHHRTAKSKDSSGKVMKIRMVSDALEKPSKLTKLFNSSVNRQRLLKSCHHSIESNWFSLNVSFDIFLDLFCSASNLVGLTAKTQFVYVQVEIS